VYHDYTQDELRAYCKSCIETLEIWARRLIHEKMCAEYGVNYIDVVLENGEPLIKGEIRKHVKRMMTEEPERFNRPVDTLFIDQIKYFLCNKKWYNKLFKEALDYMYPQGSQEAREFLTRLEPIRNPLSHSNPISIRQVEQAICYSHDFIDGLKQYYKDRDEEKVWNVPRIIKVKDSLGNCFENLEEENGLGIFLRMPQEFRCGEAYSIEIEVDPTFDRDGYEIYWYMRYKRTEFFNDTKCTITFDIKDVGTTNILECTVKQDKPWHKYGDHDSKVVIGLTVLPPIE